MARLSCAIENIKEIYSVVVIGSGYGGGTAASRLARAGQHVCVLRQVKNFSPEIPPIKSWKPERSFRLILRLKVEHPIYRTL